MAIHQSFNLSKIPSLIVIRLLSLMLLICGAIATPLAMAAACQDIFTDPASGNHPNALTPPIDLVSKGNVQCDKGGCTPYFPDSFKPGDYKYSTGHFSHLKTIFTDGKTTRLYFDSLHLDNADINPEIEHQRLDGDEHDLIIYVAGTLTMRNHSHINGIVYVAGTVDMDASSSIEGGLASGGALTPAIKNQIDVELDDINEADFGNLCHGSWVIDEPLHIQYGQANGITSTVQFEQPFPAGVKPVVFLMPAIDKKHPDSATPAAAFFTQVSSTGFTWVSKVAPYKKNNNKKGVPQVSPINWIAVSPGNHTLPNGKQLIVGTREILHEDYARTAYEELPSLRSYDVLLSQIQTPASNNCWLTSFTQTIWTNPKLKYPRLETEASTAPQSKVCYGSIQVGYLAVKSGTGTINLNGHSVRYQFGVGKTAPQVYGKNPTLSQQCQSVTKFKPHFFDSDPIVIAGRESRKGGDGGWLRRCELSEDSVSMVIDETRRVNDSHRSHTQETYGYIALQPEKEPELSCLPEDTFSNDHLSDKWIAEKLSGSLSPEVNNGRMVITEDRGDQAASLTYKYFFPAAGNLIKLKFDYYAWSRRSGKGADGVSVVFSDAEKSPAPGGFGGSLGYAQRNRDGRSLPGFNGGWLGIAMDEWGNFSSTEGNKVGGPGTRAQSIAIRGSDKTGYAYITGAPSSSYYHGLNPPLDLRNQDIPGPGDTYTFTLDTRQPDATYVSVERNIKNTNKHQTIIDHYDISKNLPEQNQKPSAFYVSLTGSTGGASNTHAIDNFQVCALNSKPVGEQVHHFEFDYSGSPLACAPFAVTIKACKNAACDQLFNTPVQAVLLPSSNGSVSWLDEQQKPLHQNIVNLKQGRAKLFLRQFIANASVKLGIYTSIPSLRPYGHSVCKLDGYKVTDCNLNFAQAGFIINDVTTYANKPAVMSIQAVKQADTLQICRPTFTNQTKLLNVNVDYLTPRFTGAEQSLQIKSGVKPITWRNTPERLAIKFDNDGKAKLNINYKDAGKLRLKVDYLGSQPTDDLGLVMTSSHGNIYSVPAGFCVAPEAGICNKTNPANCEAYVRAGDKFTLLLSAHAWQKDRDNNYCDNDVTPSFSMQGIELGDDLVAPSTGRVGTLAVTRHDMNLGRMTKVNQSISEVGVFKFTAQNPSNRTYLNAGLTIASATSPDMGRFVPAAFEVNQVQFSPACMNPSGYGFSYMGQPFNLGFNAVAINMNRQQTYNYFGDFAKGRAHLVADNNLNGVDLSSRLAALPALNWQQGKANVPFTSLGLFHRADVPRVDGPYEQLDIGLQIEDNDTNIAVMANPDMNSIHAGGCGSDGVTCTAKRLGMQQMLFGRVVMDNVYGAEADILRMPTTAQYWDGQNWQVNQLDSCTVIDNTHLLGHGEDLYSPAIVAGQSVTREDSPGLQHFQQGKFELLWQDQLNDALPVDKQYYRGEIIAPLAVSDYLKYYWQWETGIPVINSNPRASADFGRYRGDDRIIYWKEV